MYLRPDKTQCTAPVRRVLDSPPQQLTRLPHQHCPLQRKNGFRKYMYEHGGFCAVEKTRPRPASAYLVFPTNGNPGPEPRPTLGSACPGSECDARSLSRWEFPPAPASSAVVLQNRGPRPRGPFPRRLPAAHVCGHGPTLGARARWGGRPGGRGERVPAHGEGEAMPARGGKGVPARGAGTEPAGSVQGHSTPGRAARALSAGRPSHLPRSLSTRK